MQNAIVVVWFLSAMLNMATFADAPAKWISGDSAEPYKPVLEYSVAEGVEAVVHQ